MKIIHMYINIILFRLPLLADAVLSKLSMGNSDRAFWEKVLSSLSNVVAECNEGARTAAQEAEMEALARYVQNEPKKTFHLVLYLIIDWLQREHLDWKIFRRKFFLV